MPTASKLKNLLRKLGRKDKLRKIALERLTEPFHLNLASVFVGAFGSFRSKVLWDCVIRPQYAYSLLNTADQANSLRVKRVTVIEFGVAAGDGLLNMCSIAERVTKLTGVQFDIVGFDTGAGMPDALDYRDHPDHYHPGDFPMHDPERLKAALPPNARLILGEVKATVDQFVSELTEESPIGFIAMDLDYYSSTRDALTIFDHPNPKVYLAMPVMYLDDISFDTHNSWCGELLAVREFNDAHPLRKIEVDRFLRTRRVFKNPMWLDQIWLAHILDHPKVNQRSVKPGPRELNNPFAAEEDKVSSGTRTG